MSDTKTRAEKKLSRIKPGHWRNKWRHLHTGEELLGYGLWPSAEIAEQKAMEFRATPKGQLVSYLGAEFVPDKSDSQGGAA